MHRRAAGGGGGAENVLRGASRAHPRRYCSCAVPAGARAAELRATRGAAGHATRRARSHAAGSAQCGCGGGRRWRTGDALAGEAMSQRSAAAAGGWRNAEMMLGARPGTSSPGGLEHLSPRRRQSQSQSGVVGKGWRGWRKRGRAARRVTVSGSGAQLRARHDAKGSGREELARGAGGAENGL